MKSSYGNSETLCAEMYFTVKPCKEITKDVFTWIKISLPFRNSNVLRVLILAKFSSGHGQMTNVFNIFCTERFQIRVCRALKFIETWISDVSKAIGLSQFVHRMYSILCIKCRFLYVWKSGLKGSMFLKSFAQKRFDIRLYGVTTILYTFWNLKSLCVLNFCKRTNDNLFEPAAILNRHVQAFISVGIFL